LRERGGGGGGGGGRHKMITKWCNFSSRYGVVGVAHQRVVVNVVVVVVVVTP